MSNDCVNISFLTTSAADGEPDDVIARWARPEDEAAAHLRRHPDATRRTLLGRSLVRALVSDCTGVNGARCHIHTDANGKPFLRLPSGGDGPAISVSHSGAFVAAAVTEMGELGIDIEHHRPNRPLSSLAEFAFGRQEQAAAATSPASFYRIWSLREAMSKASGQGLREAADGTDRILGGPEVGAWIAEMDSGAWLLAHTAPTTDYSLAIAVRPARDEYADSWSMAAIRWWRPDAT